jgi:hypothetical protein
MTYQNLLIEDNKNILADLLDRCNTIKPINLATVKLLCEDAARATQASKVLPHQLDLLLSRWYDSLVAKNPDYSVYGEDEYIAELWACWKIYSKAHLTNIQKPASLLTQSIVAAHQDDKIIVDLGCGFAYTTATFTQIFPQATVFGTNLDNTLQMSVAKTMAHDYGFTMKTDASEIGTKADLVFASEYFEHFDQPLDHLDYIIDTINPRAMLIANAFGPRAIGHFDHYVVDGITYTAKQTGKLFNARMKKHGYVRCKTKLWNSRPAYWKKST